MFMDTELLFSDAQAVTAAAASTNYLDLAVAVDISVGTPVFISGGVDVAMTDGSSDSTLDVDAYYDSTTTFTPDRQQLLHIIPAVSAIGYDFFASLNPLSATLYRYLQLYFTPNNGNLSAGSFTIGANLQIQRNNHYASGFTITS